jgi:pimeloyl-ACP methyl ester carboxylesterase
MRDLDWITEIRLDAAPGAAQRVMMFSGFASSPEVLRELGTAIHERLPATVLMHGLPRHSGDEKAFFRSRAWHYWREAEEIFLKYWKEEEKPIALIGYSTGANVALTIAARHPSKVSGIILLSPYLLSRSISTRALSYGVAGLYYIGLPLLAAGSMAYAIRKLRHRSWSKRRAFRLAAFSLAGSVAAATLMRSATVDIGKSPTLLRDGEEVRAPHFERVSMIGGATLVPFQLVTRWIARKTMIPITYIFGVEDSVVDVEYGVMMARRNPRADLLVLSNTKHRVVTEPAVCDIVCTAILKGFDEESARQREFADVDISPEIEEELEGQAT